MKKKMLFGLFVALISLITGCSKNVEDDVENLLRPTPTAIVLMPSEVVIQNGTMLLLPFRVNPSNYTVSLNNLSLDVVEHTITRSSYVTSIEKYTLKEVESRKGSDGVVREGEWVAKIEIKDGAYYSKSALALVLSYTDANNNQVLMTSSTITGLNTRVKLSDDMVKVESTYASSLVEADYTPIASYIQIVPCPISEGSSTLFDMNDVIVKSALLSTETAPMFDIKVDKNNPFRFYITPNYLFKFPDDESIRSVVANAIIVLEDVNGGQEVTKEVSIRYYRSEYSTPIIEISKARIAAEFAAGNRPIIDIPLADALSKIGVTSKIFEGNYPPTALTAMTKFYNSDGTTAISTFINKLMHEDDNVATPEKDYVRLTFFTQPNLGDFYIGIEMTYRNINEEQPRIFSTMKINIRITD